MANNPDVGKGKSFPKAFPEKIKNAALQRYALGESTRQIGESMGIASSTILAWSRKEGVKKGSALEPEKSQLYDTPDHVLTTFQKELKNKRVDEALGMFLKMQDSVEDKYRVLMAQQLYTLLHSVMANPPPIKNWSDVDKAHKVMKDILNFDKGAGGGKNGSNLNIQFEVVGAKPTTIDVEVTDAEETQSPGDRP